MPLWAIAALFMVASVVITALITPHNSNTAQASTLADFDFPQDDEGTPQAVIFGDVWQDGWFVIWYGNLRTKEIKAKGGKK